MKTIDEMHQRIAELEEETFQKARLIRKLASFLRESHDDEISRDHFGDGPEKCSYCRAISEAICNAGLKK